MRRKLLTMTMTAVIGLPLAAAAHPDKGGEHKSGGMMPMMLMFEDMDKNSDKSISHEEFTEYRMAKYKEADTDGNGQVSKAEFNNFMERERERHRQKMQDRMFKRIDKNGNGSISQDELQAAADEHFKYMDSDGNGQLTREDHRGKGKMHHRGNQDGE